MKQCCKTARLEERAVAAKELAVARREADATALALVKEQNARHFDELNHEAARVKEMQGMSVSREKFDAFADSVNKWQGAMMMRMVAIASGATVAWYFISKVFLK